MWRQGTERSTFHCLFYAYDWVKFGVHLEQCFQLNSELGNLSTQVWNVGFWFSLATDRTYSMHIQHTNEQIYRVIFCTIKEHFWGMLRFNTLHLISTAPISGYKYIFLLGSLSLTSHSKCLMTQVVQASLALVHILNIQNSTAKPSMMRQAGSLSVPQLTTRCLSWGPSLV